jgi:type IV secretory pathway TraG/TraD family ATPase VirD4
MSDRLATASWEAPGVVSARYPFAEGKFWLGRAEDGSPLGYRDDRHICLVSGTRSGKGTSVIVNNLCFWPGSAVVCDPKGENATVSCSRRGQGDQYCTGLGQSVHVLDPFMAADVDEGYRSSFNPFDALDPNHDETIDEASRLANAIVVVKPEAHDPFWDESARSMVRGLILHVLTADHFMPHERNFIMVRNLVMRGEWQLAERMREAGIDEEKIGSPHLLLWRTMESNPAFEGKVAGLGSRFRNLMKSADRTFEGILQSVSVHTEFLDSPGMCRCLEKSDFKLSELKTRPEGLTLYLCLPQRYMDTHYRWLRMMVALTTTEMEVTRGNPATGHPVLMVLDEFAGLRRMEAIENAVAQIAGFGVKLFFVLQSLEQLKATYKDKWETFLANAGLKIFFSIEDHFTREYVSKLVGETELIRELQSVNESSSESKSHASGYANTTGSTTSQATGDSVSQTETTSHSTNTSHTETTNQSSNWNRTWGENEGSSSGGGWSPGGSNSSWSNSHGYNQGVSHGGNTGSSSSDNKGDTHGTSSGRTAGRSFTDTLGSSQTAGTTETTTASNARTSGTGRTESLHRRPLIQPDEVGRIFARIDDKKHPFYPSLALVLVTGGNPLIVRRAHYFEDLQFIDCFSPHPDHEFLAPCSYMLDGIRPLIDRLQAAAGRSLTISTWFIKAGDLSEAAAPIAQIDHVPPDNRTASIYTLYSGKVTQTAAVSENLLPSGDYIIPEWPLLTVKNYPNAPQEFAAVDPFFELEEAWSDCEKARLKAEAEVREARERSEAAARVAWEKTEKEAHERAAEERRKKESLDLFLCALVLLAATIIIFMLWHPTHATPPPETKITAPQATPHKKHHGTMQRGSPSN